MKYPGGNRRKIAQGGAQRNPGVAHKMEPSPGGTVDERQSAFIDVYLRVGNLWANAGRCSTNNCVINQPRLPHPRRNRKQRARRSCQHRP